MTTTDTDLGARPETGADRFVGSSPTGPDAWPSADLAARRSAAQRGGEAASAAVPDQQEPEPMSERQTPPAAVEPDAPVAAASSAARASSAPAAVPGDPRRPSKLLADLTTAMRSTALAARDQALAQVERDATSAVEAIRTGSIETTEALRHRTDSDVEAIREWSKAEVIRIKAESEARTAQRRADLEEQLAAEAAAVEQRIFDVHDTLARYQAEMAAFFERLVAETDPARLATMAETMPEPPALPTAVDLPPLVAAVLTPADELPAGVAPGADAPDAVEADGVIDAPDAAAAEAEALAALEALPPVEALRATEVPEPEPAADAVSGVGEVEEAVREAATTVEPVAAEGEAPVAEEEEAPHEDGRSFAGRLASFLPHRGDDAEGEAQTTQVIVTGLASVASIASFKRGLGRVAGVTSVSVSSGPDGEFVFSAVHRPSARLADAIPWLQGFEAEVSRTGDGVLVVAANDPDSEG